MTTAPHVSAHSPGLAVLRRWSLIVLVGAVAGLGMAGIGVIMFAYDSESIYRILGTAGVLGAAALLVLAMTDRAQRHLVHMWFFHVVLTGTVVHTVLDIIAIWFESRHFGERAFFSSFAFLGATILATPAALALRRRLALPVCGVGLAIALVALLWTEADLWFNLSTTFRWHSPSSYQLAYRITATLWILALIPAHACIVLLADSGRAPSPLRWSAIAFGAITGAALSYRVLFDLSDDDLLLRGIAAGAIFTTVLTVVTLVASRFRAYRERAARGAAIPIELTCPACQSNQTLATGDSACSQCGCQFSIKVTPKACLGCGYSLANLRDRTCPECGRGF